MEKAKCECTDDKESCDLKSILEQQLGKKYPEYDWPGSGEITGAKHLQCIIVISIKASVLEFVLQESQTKEPNFSCLCSKVWAKGKQKRKWYDETNTNIAGWKYFLKRNIFLKCTERLDKISLYCSPEEEFRCYSSTRTEIIMVIIINN